MTTDTGRKFRLITRSDFDGLVCAILLEHLDLINEIMFVHPKDMQDGKIPVGENDITANLPYVPGCHLAFDHHVSESLRTANASKKDHVLVADAPSAAQVIYDYYGSDRFPNIPTTLMEAVNKSDSANFTKDEVLNPQGWTLLSFLMDARTGLGRYKHFRISNYQLMMNLIQYCHDLPIEKILVLPDVKERLDLYRAHENHSTDQLQRLGTMRDDIVIFDLRGEDAIFVGNRFKIYAVFPDARISIHVMHGRNQRNTVLAVGKSIFRRDHPANIGEILLRYGGGGHDGAGTCQVDPSAMEVTLEAIIEDLSSARNA